jgi:hypothetical protein
MNPEPAATPAIPAAAKPARSPEQTLRQLFLTLFLRGRSARGLQKSGVPQSVARKLSLTMLFYGLFGFMALIFLRQPVFALSLYLHGMTLVFLGMFVAASAGEVLFNQQEADILLHRPVDPRALLWAKIAVLVQVSLWLAGAFNLAGLVAGAFAEGGGWLYLPVHACSMVLEALFCTGSVVLGYQLCLRWFGREKLDGLMTTAQVFMAIAVVAGGQIVPRLMGQFGDLSKLATEAWWMFLLPPAWFAGLDDALAGQGAASSWELAGLGVAVTAVILWLAFGRLANDYVAGLQALGESGPAKPAARSRQRWLGLIIGLPPLCWWLRNPLSRASFQLTVAYLLRDRDMKLRVYPGLAPMLVMPFFMLWQGHAIHAHGRHGGGAEGGGFGIAFAGAYLGLIPMLAMSMIQYSQHWQAADLFRSAPLAGPGALYHGARRAVLLILVVPLVGVIALLAWLLGGELGTSLMLLLPGILVIPLYALIPGLGGRAIPLSQPTESAKAAGRGLRMFGVMFVSLALAGMASFAWSQGWFGPFLIGETVVTVALYFLFRLRVDTTPWPSME